MLWGDEIEIEEKNPRLLITGYDESILTNDEWKVTFFGAEDDGKIVGVNSGFKTTPTQYRSRGLFVLPECRKQGIGSKLLQATCDQGEKEGAQVIWSYPRRNAMPCYNKVGFKIITKGDHNKLFGWHNYVIKVIKC